MAKNKSWRKICGLKKSQECFNCANKQNIIEDKNKILVACNIGHGIRTIEFSRYRIPFCGAWKEK